MLLFIPVIRKPSPAKRQLQLRVFGITKPLYQGIQRAGNIRKVMAAHMCVHHGRFGFAMAQQLLNVPQARAVFQQVGGITVP